MKKTDLLIGFLIGLLGAFLGTFFALQFLTEQGFLEGFKLMKQEGTIGKVITLGAIPNLIVFFILLKKNKDLMARGIVLSMFLLTIITLVL